MLESSSLTCILISIDSIALLGQEPAPTAAPPWQQVLFNPMSMIAVLIVLFYVMVLIPERRSRNALTKKLAALKKNDRVVTLGGIHGTVVSTSDNDLVVLRIDDNNNTRIHVNRSAISRVLDDSNGKE